MQRFRCYVAFTSSNVVTLNYMALQSGWRSTMSNEASRVHEAFLNRASWLIAQFMHSCQSERWVKGPFQINIAHKMSHPCPWCTPWFVLMVTTVFRQCSVSFRENLNTFARLSHPACFERLRLYVVIASKIILCVYIREKNASWSRGLMPGVII